MRLLPIARQVRTFKMNYKRIFGLKPSVFVTIDPSTFEVTNTFKYGELEKLKVRRTGSTDGPAAVRELLRLAA